MAQIHINEGFRALMPPMTSDMRSALKDSIDERGITDPITVWAEEGIILDGCYRYELAIELGIGVDKIPVREMSFPNEIAAKLYRIEHNLVRRQLNTYQRIMAVEACGELFEAKKEYEPQDQNDSRRAPKKLWECPPQSDGDTEFNSDTPEDVVRAYRKDDDSLTLAEDKTVKRVSRKARRIRKTGYRKAKTAGTNEETYRQALWIRSSNNNEIIDAVQSGEMSINKAYKLLKSATKEPDNKLTHHRSNVHKAFALLEEAYKWLTTQRFEQNGEDITDKVRAAMKDSIYESDQMTIAFESFTLGSVSGIISVIPPDSEGIRVV